jgi:hypothetical protein
LHAARSNSRKANRELFESTVAAVLARVSTGGREVALQLYPLDNAGAEQIYQDVGSGSLRSRSQLDECVADGFRDANGVTDPPGRVGQAT